MSSLLPQLQINESLLLYLVGELPPEDRALIEGRLKADEGLRLAYEELAHAYGQFDRGMGSLDEAAPIHADVASAVRRASGAIRQWQARPVRVSAPKQGTGQSHRWPKLVISSAAAAVVLAIGLALYSGSGKKSGYASKTHDRRIEDGAESRSGRLPQAAPASSDPSQDEVASLIGMTGQELDATDNVPGLDDSMDNKTLPERGPVFDIPPQ